MIEKWICRISHTLHFVRRLKLFSTFVVFHHMVDKNFHQYSNPPGLKVFNVKIQ
jgi:hypothetical protein